MNGFKEYKAINIIGNIRADDQEVYFKSDGIDVWKDARTAFKNAFGHTNISAILDCTPKHETV